MIDGVGNRIRIAATEVEKPAEPENSIAKEVVDQPNPKILSAQDSGIRKAELAFGGSAQAAFLQAQLGQVAKSNLVGAAGADPVENDPAFQQLPAETKERVKAELQNTTDETAKANIRKLATDPSFGSVSPETQKEALQDLVEDPTSEAHVQGVRRTCSDMASVENSSDFKALPQDTQANLRTSMFHQSGNDRARDALISFAHNPDFAKMSSANQQRMIGAYLANTSIQPSGMDNSSQINNIIGSPSFQKMDEATQAQVLSMARENSADEKSMQSISKLLRDSNFEQISPASQKAALEDLAETPSSDEHMRGVLRTCSDMVHLENSSDFNALPPDTQGALRTAMFHNSGKDTARDALIGFAHNPDFAKMSSANQQRMIGAYLTNTNIQPSGSDNSVHFNNIIASPSFQKMDEGMQQQVLVLASRNSSDEKSMQSISKLLRDSNFEQISPASQKEALEDLAEAPSSDEHMRGVLRTCSDMVHLDNSSDFQALPPDTQGALRTAMFHNSGKDTTRDALISFAHNPDFAKMSSANQQRMIGAYLTNTNIQPSGSDNSVHFNNMIGSPSFQAMDESMQQRVLTLASRNSASEERMKGLSDLLRDPQFVNASREDQFDQLRAFEVHDPNQEL